MRLFLKTCSYGAVHFIVATAVAYALTRDIAISLGIGIIEPLVQTVVFAVHDHLWEGKGKQPRAHVCAVRLKSFSK